MWLGRKPVPVDATRGLRTVRPVAPLACALVWLHWTIPKLPMSYKVPLVFLPQPEGGFTVTSPLLPELVTEGDTVKEALALAAVIESYHELGRKLPPMK